ncbi:hypothetical protein DP516_23470 [Salmonella enterica]|nr:hypothetical protein [Salmonella enterica]
MPTWPFVCHFNTFIAKSDIIHSIKKPAVASSDKKNPRECEDCYFWGGSGSGIQWVTPIISIPSQ